MGQTTFYNDLGVSGDLTLSGAADENVVVSGIININGGYIAGIMGWGNPNGTLWSDLNGTYVKTATAVTPVAYQGGNIGMHTQVAGTHNYYLSYLDPSWNGIAYFLAPGNRSGWGDPNNDEQTDPPVNYWRLCVGTINVNGCKIIKVRNHGPDTASEREWPDNILAHVKAQTKRFKTEKIGYVYNYGRNASLKIFNSLPIGVQAQFSPVFTASDKAAESGDYSTARDIVATCVVPEELQPAQQALVALLEHLVDWFMAIKNASTVDEIQDAFMLYLNVKP